MKAKQKNLIRYCQQNGRSMVEMLGVLAVIGILAITGIVGMQYALQVHRENETVNAFAVAVQGAKTAELSAAWLDGGADSRVIEPRMIVSVPDHTYRGDFFVTDTKAPVQVKIEDSHGFTVRIAGISKEVCEQIQAGRYGETCASIGSTFDGCGNTSLDELNCDHIDIRKAEFNQHTRKSAFQQADEEADSYETVAGNYNALMLYFGFNTLADRNRRPNHNPGSDNPDPDNPPYGCIGPGCDPINPEIADCVSAGGIFNSVTSTCCDKYNIGAALGTTQEIVECCIEGSARGVGSASNSAPIGVCCENAGMQWHNGICCEVDIKGYRTGYNYVGGNAPEACPPEGCAAKKCTGGARSTLGEDGSICCCGYKAQGADGPEDKQVSACCPASMYWVCADDDPEDCSCQRNPGGGGDGWIKCIPNSPYYGNSKATSPDDVQETSGCCGKMGGVWVKERPSTNKGTCCINQSGRYGHYDKEKEFTEAFELMTNGILGSSWHNTGQTTDCCEKNAQGKILPYFAGGPGDHTALCCNVTNVPTTVKTSKGPQTVSKYVWVSSGHSGGADSDSGTCCVSETPFAFGGNAAEACCKKIDASYIFAGDTCCQPQSENDWDDTPQQACCEMVEVSEGKKAVWSEEGKVCCNPESGKSLGGKKNSFCCKIAGRQWAENGEDSMCCPSSCRATNGISITVDGGSTPTKFGPTCCNGENVCTEDGPTENKSCACCAPSTIACGS